MRILQVSAEYFPLLKTGGLADVAGALPLALAAAGQDVRVLLPGFPAIVSGVAGLEPLVTLKAPWGQTCRVLRGRVAAAGAAGAADIAAYVIDAPTLYDRPGNPYEDAQRQPYADNARRFALLGWVAAQLASGADPAWQADVMHAHDWHAALAPAYLAFAPARGRRPVGSVFTVHNLAFQGLFAAGHFAELGLPAAAFQIHGLEFHGQLSFMKGGLQYASRISTVSPTYAREIQTPEQGHGLDGLLRERSGVLTGILNAVDEQVWNPATDTLLAARYDLQHIAAKAACKAALQRQLGLAELPAAPFFIVVSRLTEQKGLHLVLEGLDALLAQGGQLALLGSGEGWLETAFRQRAGAAPTAVSATIGYNEALAHQLFGAGDVVLVPSLFEPCGLTQMYGLKYGCLPLVRRVGGLADTVVDCTLEDLADGHANGFVFERFDTHDYLRAQRRAFTLYQRPADWQRVRATGMRRPAGWSDAAAQYVELYRQAVA